MNTSSQRLVKTLTLIVSLSPAAGWAMPQARAMPVWLAAAAVGDDGSQAGDTAKADELIRQARKAMVEGHLQLADSCISRAEALNPKYSIFHIGDTPAKCRARPEQAAWHSLNGGRPSRPVNGVAERQDRSIPCPSRGRGQWRFQHAVCDNRAGSSSKRRGARQPSGCLQLRSKHGGRKITCSRTVAIAAGELSGGRRIGLFPFRREQLSLNGRADVPNRRCGSSDELEYRRGDSERNGAQRVRSRC